MANWLDKAIEVISPKRGFERARYRAAIDVVRTYEGAKAGRGTDNWLTTGTSANAVIAPALHKLRDRSRDLVRNNPHAKKAINTLVARSIGTGIQAKTKLIEWKQWCKECDFDGQLTFEALQAQIARCVFESGECLIRFRYRKLNEGFAIPLQIQVLEPDFLDTNKNGLLSNGNYVIAGIEVNSSGQREAYWLYDQHPGDALGYTLLQWQSKRVLAQDIIHVYEKERPGQLRGVPRLAVSIIKIRYYDEFDEAELVRKKIEACFTAFISSDDDVQAIGPVKPDSVDKQKRIETVEPGMFVYGRANESITFGAPNAVQGYPEYSSVQLHAIAAGVGVTYEAMTGDLTGVNFSSIRTGTHEFRALIESFQWLTFIPMVCDKIAAKVADVALISGVAKKRKPVEVWTTPKWPWTDPLKDVQAEALAIATPLKSLSESIRESGYDPDEVFAEIAAEREKLKKFGINLTLSAAKNEKPTETDNKEETAKEDSNEEDSTTTE